MKFLLTNALKHKVLKKGINYMLKKNGFSSFHFRGNARVE